LKERDTDLMLTTSSRASRKGFTLIELLVVIAIIAILAAILFPVFQKVRENARRTACLSNMKQIGLAFMQYNQDYDETFPYSTNYGSGWAERIFPYAKSIAMFQCPDDSSPDVTGGGVVFYHCSYTASDYVMEPNFSVAAPSPTSIPAILAQFTGPSNTVLIYEGVIQAGAESTQASANHFNPFVPIVTPVSTSSHPDHLEPYWTVIATGRHSPGTVHPIPGNKYFTNGSDNYIMADGHVKYLPWEKVSDLDHPAGPDGSNPAKVDNLGPYAVTFSMQ